jgi:hypothetical protein
MHNWPAPCNFQSQDSSPMRLTQTHTNEVLAFMAHGGRANGDQLHVAASNKKPWDSMAQTAQHPQAMFGAQIRNLSALGSQASNQAAAHTQAVFSSHATPAAAHCQASLAAFGPHHIAQAAPHSQAALGSQIANLATLDTQATNPAAPRPQTSLGIFGPHANHPTYGLPPYPQSFMSPANVSLSQTNLGSLFSAHVHANHAKDEEFELMGTHHNVHHQHSLSPNVPVQHSNAPIQHSSALIQHSSASIQHSNAPIQHSNTPIQHSKTSFQHSRPEDASLSSKTDHLSPALHERGSDATPHAMHVYGQNLSVAKHMDDPTCKAALNGVPCAVDNGKHGAVDAAYPATAPATRGTSTNYGGAAASQGVYASPKSSPQEQPMCSLDFPPHGTAAANVSLSAAIEGDIEAINAFHRSPQKLCKKFGHDTVQSAGMDPQQTHDFLCNGEFRPRSVGSDSDNQQDDSALPCFDDTAAETRCRGASHSPHTLISPQTGPQYMMGLPSEHDFGPAMVLSTSYMDANMDAAILYSLGRSLHNYKRHKPSFVTPVTDSTLLPHSKTGLPDEAHTVDKLELQQAVASVDAEVESKFGCQTGVHAEQNQHCALLATGVNSSGLGSNIAGNSKNTTKKNKNKSGKNNSTTGRNTGTASSVVRLLPDISALQQTTNTSLGGTTHTNPKDPESSGSNSQNIVGNLLVSSIGNVPQTSGDQ